MQEINEKHKITAFLVVLFGLVLANFCIDNFLPSLPVIQRALNADPSGVKIAVPIHAVGVGLASLVYGIVIPHKKRKMVLYHGVVISLIGALLCSFSSNIFSLILGRMINGFGVGVIITSSIIIFTDIFKDAVFIKIMAVVSFVTALVPSISPMCGGYIQAGLGWRANFLVQAIGNFIFLLLVYGLVGETKRDSADKVGSLLQLCKNYAAPLENYKFNLGVLCGAVVTGGYFVYLTVGPHLYEVVLGLTPIQYGHLAVYTTFGLIGATVINMLFIGQIGIKRIMYYGSFIGIIGSFAMLIFCLLGHMSVMVIILPMAIFIFGSFLVELNIFPYMIIKYPQYNALAPLFIFLQLIISSSIGVSASYMPGDSQFYLSVIITLSSIILLISLGIILRKVSISPPTKVK
jgi:DHA1 family bicyclomycin/chloramphenicol resistance-like MFS transporter/DHA1 family 2-module integral membrane pump EmrD-like MFS transporter